MARKTRQEFVEQAQQVHGDRFDYSEVEYVNTHTPVKIRCRRCGLVFQQEPSSHLAGRGCPKCSKKQMHKRVNQDMFIAKAREIHGDKYDYSKTVYQDMHGIRGIGTSIHNCCRTEWKSAVAVKGNQGTIP